MSRSLSIFFSSGGRVAAAAIFALMLSCSARAEDREEGCRLLVADSDGAEATATAATPRGDRTGPHVGRVLFTLVDFPLQTPPSPRQMFEVLREVLEREYSGESHRMTVEALERLRFRPPSLREGTEDRPPVTGAQILQLYGFAHWLKKKKRPITQASFESFLADEKFSLDASLDRFIKERDKLGRSPDPHTGMPRLSIAGDADADYFFRQVSGFLSERPDLNGLSSDRLLAKPVTYRQWALFGSEGPSERTVAFRSVLQDYSLLRWKLDNPRKRKIPADVTELEGYSAKDSLYFLRGRMWREEVFLKSAKDQPQFGDPKATKRYLDEMFTGVFLSPAEREILRRKFGPLIGRLEMLDVEHFNCRFVSGRETGAAAERAPNFFGSDFINVIADNAWEKDHPGQHLDEGTNASSLPGYTPEETIDRLIRERFRIEPAARTRDGIRIPPSTPEPTPPQAPTAPIPAFIPKAGFTLQSLSRFPIAEFPDLTHLESVLFEILERQFGMDTDAMSGEAIRNTYYTPARGEGLRGKALPVIRGEDLLALYAVARAAHFGSLPKGPINAAKVLQDLGGVDGAVERFVEMMLEFRHGNGVDTDSGILHELKQRREYDVDASCPSFGGDAWSIGTSAVRPFASAALMKAIGEDAYAFVTLSEFEKIKFKSTKGAKLAVTGSSLLALYSLALWNDAHPDQMGKAPHDYYKQPGFTPGDALNHLKGSCVPHSGLTVKALNKAETFPELEREIDNVMSEIFARFLLTPRELRGLRGYFNEGVVAPAGYVDEAFFRSYHFKAEDGITAYDGEDLLRTYAKAHRIGRDAVMAHLIERYREVKPIARDGKGVYDWTPPPPSAPTQPPPPPRVEFGKVGAAELTAFIRKHDLQEILDAFEGNPATLIEALPLLTGNLFQNQDVAAFVKAHLALKIKNAASGPRRPRTPPSHASLWAQRRAYVAAVMQALELRENFDLSETSFQAQVQLSIRMSRQRYQENPLDVIRTLTEEAAELEKTTDTGIMREGKLFLARVNRAVALHFQQTREFSFPKMKSDPFPYQVEGAKFLVDHDRAILADEAGLGKTYQAVAACLAAKAKRVLWVTPAGNKGTLREEIIEHSYVPEKNIVTLTSGDPTQRKSEIDTLPEEAFIIVNYENLVWLRRNDRASYDKLVKSVDTLIVDEGHLADNPDTYRSEAVFEIGATRRWILTATPYQSDVKRLWTLLHFLFPKEFPSQSAFNDLYTRDAEGLMLLANRLRQCMLRRNKGDTLLYFEPETAKKYVDQLKGGVPRVARKIRISPQEEGGYTFLREQTVLLSRMTSDFPGWAREFNANLPAGAKAIDLDKINPLVVYNYMQKVIYQPEYFGIEGENPLFAAIDTMVEKRIQAGEKVILWAEDKPLVAALEKRYKKHGLRKIDGSVRGKAREQARHDFQEKDDVKVLVANYKAGGTGLTLSAAHTALFVQLPPAFPMLYQAEARHQRVIGLNNARFAREFVYSGWLVGRYDPAHLGVVEDPETLGAMQNGSPIEQAVERLAAGENLYQLLLAGYATPEEIDALFKVGLFSSLGLIKHDSGEPKLGGPRKQSIARVSKAFLPVWKRVEGRPELEERVLDLVYLFQHNPDEAKAVAKALEKQERIRAQDLDGIISVFEIRNKHLRLQMLESLPSVLQRELDEAHVDSGRRVGVSHLVPHLLGDASALSRAILKKVEEEGDSPRAIELRERFLVGILGVRGTPWEAWLKEHEALLTAAPVAEAIEVVFRVGTLQRLSAEEAIEAPSLGSSTTGKALREKVDAAACAAIGELAERPVAAVKKYLGTTRNAVAVVDGTLALAAGYHSMPESMLPGRLQEALQNAIDSTFKSWRYGDKRREGSDTEYLSANKEFWRIMAENTSITVDGSVATDMRSLADEYAFVFRRIASGGFAEEGDWVKRVVLGYRGVKETGQRAEIRATYEADAAALGAVLGEWKEGELVGKAAEVMLKYELLAARSLDAKQAIRDKKQEIDAAIHWMILEDALSDPKEASLRRAEPVLAALQLKESAFRRVGSERAADDLMRLMFRIKQRTRTAARTGKVTIAEVDDYEAFLLMGSLSPEMRNCFNPSANPDHTQFVVNGMGSKAMKMIIATSESGYPLAGVLYKVKRLIDDDPVLFPERGMYSNGYNYRREMIALLRAKALRLREKARVQAHVGDELIRGNEPESIVVYGIGAWLEDAEYVESVFAFRRAYSVRHRGRLVPLE